jgi:hypothetical protein
MQPARTPTPSGLKSVRENCSFAPLGLLISHLPSHGLRRGLHSYAALRLNPEPRSTMSPKIWFSRIF